MALSKAQREFIGRSSALAVSVALAWFAFCCVTSSVHIAREAIDSGRSEAGDEPSDPEQQLTIVGWTAAVGAIGLFGVAVAPSLTVGVLERTRGNPGEPSDFGDD